jgi:hypothetical protein
MRPRIGVAAGLFSLSVLVVVRFAAGQTAGGKLTPPTLDPILPPGGQRGTAVEVTLAGRGIGGPHSVWLDAAGVTISPAATTGKDSTQFRARMEVSPTAPLGMHRLRLTTAGGLSNLRPFCIDALPEVPESETNHSPAAAQPVPVPCVVTGRADAETSDFFKFTLAANQRLSFEVLGRRLGSRFDPVLRLYDAAGHELPAAASDDAPGLQSDARLTHTFAAAGDYLVEVRDTTDKGGPDFWYRLRIGDFPCAVTPLPAAARRGTKAVVNFAGPQVEGVAPVEVQIPADPAIEAVSVAPVGANGLPGWPVSLLLSDHDELVTGESIGTLAQAQKLTPPCGVTGRFRAKGQKDHFSLLATKNRRFRIAAQTGELNSPAEVYLTIRDGAGAELAHTDPQRDPVIDFTAPADGNYFLVVEHLNYAFGPSEVYRLTVTPPASGFDLTLETDRVALPQGQAGLIPVATLVRRDYGGPIELSVVGPPGLSGSVTVPAGVQAVPPPIGPDEKPPPKPPPVAQLPVHAAAEVGPGIYEITVMAKAVADGKQLVAFASTKTAVQAQMAGLPRPPREWLRGVGVAVMPRPPFSLAALWERPEAVPGLGNRLVVVATRDPGFDGGIDLSATGLPPGVSAAAASIPKGQAAATLDLKLSEKAGLGSFPFVVVGRTRQQNRELTGSLLPSPLVIAAPFDLKVDPNPLPLETGRQAVLTVTAHRKGGYTGPIGLELRNLPAQVTAGPATIRVGETSATVPLTAAAGAPLASRGDVDVLGTAKLGNQQAASPPFTIRVQAPPAALVARAEPDTVKLKPGEKAKVKVTVDRKHFAGPVAVTVQGLPAKVTAGEATVPADASAVDIELSAAADAPAGQAEATLTAKAAATATVKIRVQIEK